MTADLTALVLHLDAERCNADEIALYLRIPAWSVCVALYQHRVHA